MVAESVRNTYVPQRSVYDERYTAGQYDKRSAVPVLTAEREALRGALDRALKSNPNAKKISIFDFGYGTGRVTNELIRNYARRYTQPKDMRVIAYDVSSVGLKKANEALRLTGFQAEGPFTWMPESGKGYIAGSLYKSEPDCTITVVFVHASEDQSPEVMRQLALKANDEEPYLLTTSWYSGLGHVPSQDLRRDYFRQLGILTAFRGEMVLAMSSTGDLIELQPEWSQKLADGNIGDFPVETSGDVVYTTELGQSNFYHVFGVELNNYMSEITTKGQQWRVEGIRYPGEEFESDEAEQANYKRVCKANEVKRGRDWNADDFREFHTVAAFRSPADLPNS